MSENHSPDQRELAILDSVNEGVFTVGLDWRITAFNHAAERITGIPAGQAIGSACCDVFRASICETSCALRRTMASGQPVLNATAHIINQQGQRVPIRISTALLKDGDGRIVGGVETFQDLTQVEQLQKELQARYTFEDIVGRSPAMVGLFDILPPIAASSSTVLIEGPSGTGKELFARAIHTLSPRKNKPFVAVNIAAIPRELIESELFGHEKGAFTGAVGRRIGKFEEAEGGTIFLDEIGDMEASLQAKLLRVLQEREVTRIGGNQVIKLDVRIIAATHKDLAEEVKAGRFREDLYYRLLGLPIHLPPLRERGNDVIIIAKHFLDQFTKENQMPRFKISEDAQKKLLQYPFPGNIRELKSIIELAAVMASDQEIRLHDISFNTSTRIESFLYQEMSMQEYMYRIIRHFLNKYDNNVLEVAKRLDVGKSSLYRYLKEMEAAGI